MKTEILLLILFSIIMVTFFTSIFYDKTGTINPQNRENILKYDTLFFRTVDGVSVIIVYDRRIITPSEIVEMCSKMKSSQIVSLSFKNIGIIEVSIMNKKENEEEEDNMIRQS